jgi:glycosyltransferase involved in cell wall biosynthesis
LAAGIELEIRGFQSLTLFRSNQYNTAPYRRVVETLNGIRRRWQDVHDALDYDLIIIQREAMPIGPPVFERWLARQGARFIYDFDDALYVHVGRWIKRAIGYHQKIREIISLSSHTIAGNSVLAEFARQHGEHVTIIPTVPYPDKYVVPGSRPSGRVTIGWSGGRNNSNVLNQIAAPLRRLQHNYDIELKVAGDSEFEMGGVRTSGVDWTFPIDDRQVWNALKTFDIGLMPLTDTPWNRGKCGFKALLYMSMGIPPVISPVGVNTDIVKDGVNGFLASTDKEWFAGLSALVSNPELRQLMGKRAREPMITV